MTNTTDRPLTTWERIVKAGLEATTFGQLDAATFKAGLHIDPLDQAANLAADEFLGAILTLADAIGAREAAEAALRTLGTPPGSTPEPLADFEGFGPVA